MRTFQVTVNGKTYDVGVEETTGAQAVSIAASTPATVSPPAPAPVSSSAPEPAKPAARTAPGIPVKAPMPGAVVKVAVSEGDSIVAGQLLAVLEAMKMENEITAAQDGTVAQVLVAAGASVEAGDVMMVIGES